MMNANAFVASSVSLLALAAGLFLLAKSVKDALGLIYKIAAWFIILASLANMGCNAMNCMFKFYKMHYMDGGRMNKMMFKQHEAWHHPDAGMKDGCADGNCHFGYRNEDALYGNEDQVHWKKRYEDLEDSCARVNSNSRTNK